MGLTPRTIAIPIFNSVYFSSAVKLAARLKSSGIFEPVFIFWSEVYSPESEKSLLLRSLGIEELRLEGHKGLHKTKFIVILASRILLVDFLLNLLSTRRFRRFIKDTISTKSIKLFMLPADNRYAYPHITSLARSSGVPVALFPSWFANETELVHIFSESRAHTNGLALGKWLGPWKSYIKLVGESGKKLKPMIPFPKSEILIRRILGAEVPNPWILNSSKADLIFIESQTAFNYAKRLGFKENNLKLTGSVFLDEMFFAQKERVSYSQSPRQRKTLIASALPPDMFSYPLARNIEFRSYESLVDAWCQALGEIPDSDVVISLHPTTSIEVRKQIEANGLKVSKEETHVLISKADLYIASISATIQWAICSLVPTVNYDVYGFAYPDYVGNPLVKEVQTFEVFRGLLASGVQDLISSVGRQSIEVGDIQVSELDGLAGQRIITEIENLLTKSDILQRS